MAYSGKAMEPMRQDSFEARIVAALEQAPSVQPSESFAGELMSRVQALPRRARRGYAGRTGLLVFAVLLVGALLWLAPRATASFGNIAFDLEMLALALLAGLCCLLPKLWRES